MALTELIPPFYHHPILIACNLFPKGRQIFGLVVLKNTNPLLFNKPAKCEIPESFPR